MANCKLAHGCLAFYEPLPDRALRVFCFYGSGQSAVNLRHLAFPAGVERCLVELPGRGLRSGASSDGSALCHDLVAVAAEAADALAPLCAEGPWTVWAYSLGCAIGFEFLRALQQRRRQQQQAWPPCRAFYLSVRRPPGMPVAPFVLPDGTALGPVEALLRGSDPALLRAVGQYYGNPQLLAMLDNAAAAAAAAAGVEAEAGEATEAGEAARAAREYVYGKLAPVVRNDMVLGNTAAECYWDPRYEDDEELGGRNLDAVEIVAFAAGAASDVDSSADAVKGWAAVTVGAPFTLHTIAEATHDGVLRHPELHRVVNEHLRKLVDAARAARET